MAFRKKPRAVQLQGVAPQISSIVVRQESPDGVDAFIFTDDCRNLYPELPSPDTFDLQALLKAGANLNEVNSVVFHDTESSPEMEAAAAAIIDKETIVESEN